MTDVLIEAYLFFSGRGEEAIEFYSQALGATLEMKMKFDESPAPVPPGMLQAGFESKIMHASIRIGSYRIMLSDGCDDKSQFSGFRLALSTSTEAEAHKMFAALSEGGKVDMPLTPTFWSPCYGMVTDRFNVGWMVMVQSDH